MFGNTLLPGYQFTGPNRVPDGSIWRSHSSATWFQPARVGGSGKTASPLPLGTIMKAGTDGLWAPFALTDLITATADLPGPRLAVVSDTTARTGYSYTPEGATEPVVVENTILVGIMGKVDRDRLLIGSTTWDDLTEAQQTQLRVQLEAWSISPIWVFQTDV